jgi:hypothetical protein
MDLLPSTVRHIDAIEILLEQTQKGSQLADRSERYRRRTEPHSAADLRVRHPLGQRADFTAGAFGVEYSALAVAPPPPDAYGLSTQGVPRVTHCDAAKNVCAVSFDRACD